MFDKFYFDQAAFDQAGTVTYEETGRTQTILASQGIPSQILTANELGKLQTILASIEGNAYKKYTEIEKEQIVLAVLNKGEQLIQGEVGREQVILSEIGESNVQSMLETGRLQIILTVIEQSSGNKYYETGKEQVILAVQSEVDNSLLNELGKTQTILTVITEADELFKILTSLKYILELHNSSGDLVAILKNAHDIAYAQMINSPHTLNFSLPADDPKVSDITLANEIWLRNYKTGKVIKKFRLSQKRDSR